MSGSRFQSLDGLRGAAALIVLGFHITWTNHITSLQFFRNGYLSVDLFFILSGFIISVAYDGRIESVDAAKDFLRRRFFRVYPLHLFILIGMILLEGVKIFAGSAAVGAPPFTGTTDPVLLGLNIFFVHGTGIADRTSWNIPSWSVSAEFVAYVIFAAGALTGVTRSRASVMFAAVMGVIAYAVLALVFHTVDLAHDFGIVRCLAGFAIGMAIYQGRKSGALSWLERCKPSTNTILEAAALVSTLLVMSLATSGFEAIAVVGFIALVIVLQEGRGAISTVLSSVPLRYLGLISYSVYLTHLPVRNIFIQVAARLGAPAERLEDGRLMINPDPFFGDLIFVGFVAVVLVISHATYRYVERPARDFGRHWPGDAAAPGKKGMVR